MKIIALVGLPGSGKSTVAKLFQEQGFKIIRFGDITEEYLKKSGLSLNEKNERAIRESLRKEHGMEAYAKLNKERIERELKHGSIIIDGLYSYEEFKFLKKEFGDEILLITVDATSEKRHERLGKREIRPLDNKEAVARDKTEIENLNIEKTIEAADSKIHNNFTEDELKEQVECIIEKLQ